MTMIFQVAGKAARDALFLSNFRSRQLPAMVIAGAVAAILLGLANSRVLGRFAPGKLIPALLFASAALLVGEYLAYSQYPDYTAIAVFIHVIALGAVLTSGFWLVINEQMDPYTAKQSFGGVAAAGTVGGVIGGFASERLAVYAPQETVLLMMAAAQAVTGALLSGLPPGSTPLPGTRVRARDVMRPSSYLKSLSLLVVIGTFSAALLDFVLKVEARQTLGPGESLMRFFGVFHAATAVLAFVVQTALTPYFLNRFGLGATIATLPAAVGGGGLLAFFTGGFSIIASVRAAEAVVRASLFRAGYELFYTPMPASEKRAVKSINDVTMDRLGDGLGGGFAQLVLTTAGRAANPILLATAAIASAVGWFVALRLNRAYIGSLERSLEQHGRDLEMPPEPDDEPIALPPALTGPLTMAAAPKLPVVVPPWLSSESAEQYLDLQSGERERIRKALEAGPDLHRSLLPMVIPMLGRRSLALAANEALEAVAYANVGQLSDWLLDDASPPPVRAAIPALLASSGNARAADALVIGLGDKHREIRYRCGIALDTMRREGDIEFEPERVYEAVREELSRTTPQMQHVSALIGLVLPREPVRIAFEGIGSEDPQLRGLALEYLESALPAGIGDSVLRALQGDSLPKRPADQRAKIKRSLEEIKQELIRVVERK